MPDRPRITAIPAHHESLGNPETANYCRPFPPPESDTEDPAGPLTPRMVHMDAPENKLQHGVPSDPHCRACGHEDISGFCPEVRGTPTAPREFSATWTIDDQNPGAADPRDFAPPVGVNQWSDEAFAVLSRILYRIAADMEAERASDD